MTDRSVLQFRDLAPADPLGDTRAVTIAAQSNAVVGCSAPHVCEMVPDQVPENIGRAAQHVINAADDVMRAAEHAVQSPINNPRGINQGAAWGSLGRPEPVIRIDPTLRSAQESGARGAVTPMREGSLRVRELAVAGEQPDPRGLWRQTFS